MNWGIYDFAQLNIFIYKNLLPLLRYTPAKGFCFSDKTAFSYAPFFPFAGLRKPAWGSLCGVGFSLPRQTNPPLYLIKGINYEILRMRYYLRKKQFNKRVVVSGNVLEVYEYEKPVVQGMGKKRIGRANTLFTSDEVKAENRGKTARRARRYVRGVVNANPHLNKFLTLTYAENLKELRRARYDFDKFIKRIKTRFKKFLYVVVIEFQKRGAVHFHLLCNLPYVEAKELAKIWGHGFIKINRIDNVDNVGAYVTKYMTKDSVDERLAGKKCYSMSKGLKQPKEYTDETEIAEIMENLENVKRVYSTEFETEFYGKVSYTQIVCRSAAKLPSKVRRFLERFKGRLTLMPDDTPTPFDSSPRFFHCLGVQGGIPL